METSERKVAQQLNFAKLLFSEIVYDSSLKDTALLQSCYLHLELAVMLYLSEVASAKNHRLLDDVWVCSLDQFMALDLSLLITVPEFCELIELSKIEDSWLAALMDELYRIRQPSSLLVKKDGLRSDLFATVEPMEEDSPSSLISVANIEGSEAGEDFLRFECLMRDFQELVIRQRANNEEY